MASKFKKKGSSSYLKAGALASGSIFLALSFFSYSPTDPSLNSFGISLKVSNYCGYVGAFLSDLFFQSFGLTSWLFIPLGFYLSAQLFMGAKKRMFSQTLILFFLFLGSISCLLNLYFSKTLFYKDTISLGGAASNLVLQSLTPFFHVIGTSLILWSIFIFSFLMYGHNAFFRFVYLLQKISISFLEISFSASKTSYFFIRKWIARIIKKDWAYLFYQVEQLIRTKKPEIPTTELIEDSHQADETIEDTNPTQPLFKFDGEQSNDEDSEDEDIVMEEEDTDSDTEIQIFTEKDRPSFDLLTEAPIKNEKMHKTEVEVLAGKLIAKLSQFSIKGKITAIKTGPAVIMFEFKPDESIKLKRIKEMADDIKIAIASESVRIIAPIPGRDVVGIEASRPSRETVYLKDILQKADFSKTKLPLILGVRSDNLVTVKDLATIPHLLIAGTTGSGKSVFVISFIMGLLFRHTPKSLRLMLVDPKRVDLSFFDGIPHLLAPIMTTCPEALAGLKWAILEMEKRYRSLSRFRVRDITSFNQVVEKLKSKDKKLHQKEIEELPQDQSYYFEPMPYICIVVEEFGDLMADAQFKREIESSVNRLAQKARASGIHLVLAMQSPRKDVVTGLIKTNISGRISFKVASGTDSRIILDDVGAERLLSRGDMLFLEPGTPKALRYHSPFVSEKEVGRVVSHWKEQGPVYYEESLVQKTKNPTSAISGSSHLDHDDPMYKQILEFVHTCDAVSASLLQRKFRIGYPRAARIVELLFEEGIIGPPHGSKPREVLK